MREIEVKARLTDNNKLINALSDAGYVISDPITQHDRVYGIVGVSGDANNSRPWLRIRAETQNNISKYIFTLKKSISGQLDSIEHETEITDELELEKIIKHMNFTLYSELTKQRQKVQVGDIEICIDYITELGAFVEAEKMTADDVDPKEIRIELWNLLKQFGVSRDDEVTDGYDVLMNKKLGMEWNGYEH